MHFKEGQQIECVHVVPREINGGSCLAMLGDKCVAIACDLRLGNQALTINCDFEKVCTSCKSRSGSI